MSTVNGTKSAYDSVINNNLATQRASGTINPIKNNGGSLAIATTNITVLSNGSKVGFIQSFSPSENRNIIKVQELGSEGVVQSVPSNTQGGQLSVSRFALYNSSIFRALGLTKMGKFEDKTAFNEISSGNSSRTTNPFKTLKHQRTPIEIEVRTETPGEKDKRYIETYIDCWLSGYTKTIASNNITITEQATIQYSDVIFSGYKISKFDPDGAGDNTKSGGTTPNQNLMSDNLTKMSR